jgi:NAD+ synthase
MSLTQKSKTLSMDVLKLDCDKELAIIATGIRNCIIRRFKKRGIVIALSGGIDSSLVAALCVQALGKNRVFGLLLPEKESSTQTLTLSDIIVEHLGIQAERQDITEILTAVGCYLYRDEAIKSVIPEYNQDYKCKIVLPSLLGQSKLRLFSVVIQSPDGRQIKARLPAEAYLQIVAATNFKQRIRMMLTYYYADKLNYAVAGTPNRQEYDQGFFVKLGDGAGDIKPIAHLYKTQVYQMARYLKLPEDICKRLPTTDTYSIPQDQEEFYFSVPHDILDLCLYAKNHIIPPEEVAKAVHLDIEQVERVYNDIDNKRRATRYQHAPPILLQKVNEITY